MSFKATPLNRYHKLLKQPEVAVGQTWLWGDNYRFFIQKINDDGTVGCTVQYGDKEPNKDCSLEISYIHRKCRLRDE